MDKQKIYASLDQEKLIPSQELESLVLHYPYFTTVQHLLSKQYNHQRDHRFAGQVQRSAIAAGNRKALRNYLLAPDPVQSQSTGDQEVALVTMKFKVQAAEPEIEKPAPKTEESLPERIPEEIESLVDQLFEEPKVTIETEEEKWAEQAEGAPNLSHVITTQEEIREETEENTATAFKAYDVYDSMDLNIISEAVNSSIQIEVSEISEEEDLPEATDAFAKWLWEKSQRNKQAEAEPASDGEMTESHWKEIDISTLFSPKANADSKEKEHQRNLIDRFIRTEPRIVPGKVSEYESGNLAKESLEEDPNLVSETMAQLFVKQGRTDKARKIYKKLMALYPEKSIYFAAQLKNLDKTKKG